MQPLMIPCDPERFVPSEQELTTLLRKHRNHAMTLLGIPTMGRLSERQLEVVPSFFFRWLLAQVEPDRAAHALKYGQDITGESILTSPWVPQPDPAHPTADDPSHKKTHCQPHCEGLCTPQDSGHQSTGQNTDPFA